MNDVETYLYRRVEAILEEMKPLTAQLIETAAALRALDGDKSPVPVPMVRPPVKFKPKSLRGGQKGRPLGARAKHSIALRKLVEKSGKAGISSAEAEAKLGVNVAAHMGYLKKSGFVTHKDHRYFLNGASRG